MPRSTSYCPHRILLTAAGLLFIATFFGCGHGGASSQVADPKPAEEVRGLTLTVSNDFPAGMPRQGISYAIELKNTGAEPISIRHPLGGKLHRRIWQEGTNQLVMTSHFTDFSSAPLPTEVLDEQPPIKTLQPGESIKFWTGAPLAPGEYRIECTYYSTEEAGVTWTGECKSNALIFTQAAAPPLPDVPTGPAYLPDASPLFDPKAAIEGLASRNLRPFITPRGGTDVCLFNRDFDWSDQDRILRTVEQIEANALAAWPELSRHFDDHRYALTYRTESMMDGKQEVVQFGASVSILCLVIWHDCLVAGFIDLLPPHAKSGGVAYSRLLSPDDSRRTPESSRAWRDARVGKPLYEAQLGMCAWAIANLSLLDNLSAEEKSATVAQIEQRVQEITETKVARLPKGFYSGQKVEYFDESQAEAIRLKYPKEYELVEAARKNETLLITPPAAGAPPTLIAPPGTTPRAYVSPSNYPVAPANPSPPTLAQPPVIEEPPVIQQPSVYKQPPVYSPASVLKHPPETVPPAIEKAQTVAPKVP